MSAAAYYWLASCDTCDLEMPFPTEGERDDWTASHATVGEAHEAFTIWRGRYPGDRIEGALLDHKETP